VVYAAAVTDRARVNCVACAAPRFLNSEPIALELDNLERFEQNCSLKKRNCRRVINRARRIRR